MDELIGTSEENNGFKKMSARKRTWSDLVVLFLNVLRKRQGPILTVKVAVPSLVGCFASAFLSHFLGNGILWSILHFCTSWIYVVYKVVEKLSPLLQG